MAAADIGNPGTRRKRLANDPQPFLIALPSATLGPRKHRHLTHRPLQKHTLKSTLKSAPYLPRQGGLRRMDT